MTLCPELSRLLEAIAEEAIASEPWTGRAVLAERVMRSLAAVPRHEFVPPRERAFAYANRPLLIGHGQTISQPFIVALMTDLLDLRPTDRVLEVGTGCGYQAAVLSALAARVITVEVIPELAEAARVRLQALGYANVDVHCADGFTGWPDEQPYDAIIVTAAPRVVPPVLCEQLREGGRLVIPVGPTADTQTLYRCVKRPDGRLDMDARLPVAFVPMVHRRTPV